MSAKICLWKQTFAIDISSKWAHFLFWDVIKKKQNKYTKQSNFLNFLCIVSTLSAATSEIIKLNLSL